jgi:hypothetical protein
MLALSLLPYTTRMYWTVLCNICCIECQFFYLVTTFVALLVGAEVVDKATSGA